MTELVQGLGDWFVKQYSPTFLHEYSCQGSPFPEFSLSKDKDREPRDEKAESTEETPESLLSLEASLDSEELRLSSSGPSTVCEIPESSWDNNSERL